MAKDFIDGDLLSLSRSRERGESDGFQVRSAISRDGLEKMAQQRSDLNHQVVDAVHEIEELKQRQNALEREKRELEELGRKQDEYTAAKSEMIEKLSGSIMILEKEEMQAARMLELFGVLRGRFKETLLELRAINEGGWSEDAYQMELNKAIVIVEDARNIFQKGIAKMEAAGWSKGVSPAGVVNPSEVALKLQSRGFMYWFKAGLAVSLPLIVFGTILFVLWLYFSGMF